MPFSSESLVTFQFQKFQALIKEWPADLYGVQPIISAVQVRKYGIYGPAYQEAIDRQATDSVFCSVGPSGKRSSKPSSSGNTWRAVRRFSPVLFYSFRNQAPDRDFISS